MRARNQRPRPHRRRRECARGALLHPDRQGADPLCVRAVGSRWGRHAPSVAFLPRAGYRAVRDEFLAPLSRRPPKVVIIYYAGRGKQVAKELFLIPTGAAYQDAHDCKQTCLSHLDVLMWLHEFLDKPAKGLSYMSGRPPVRFLLALDMCRDDFGASEAALQGCDPEQPCAPILWSLCLSTSRGSAAQAGHEGAHSPFAKELLDPAEGIFAPGVALKEGIDRACGRMMEEGQQRPVCNALERLPDALCVNAGAETGKRRAQEGADGAGGGGRGDGKKPAIDVGSAQAATAAAAAGSVHVAGPEHAPAKPRAKTTRRTQAALGTLASE